MKQINTRSCVDSGGTADASGPVSGLATFIAIGVIVSAITWAVLVFSHARNDDAARRPVIRTAMNADELGGGTEVSWDTIEVKQFHDYANKQGWEDTELIVTRFVGADDTIKYIAGQIAGVSPDVIIASRDQISFFDAHNLIEPLDPYLEKWKDYRDGKFDASMLDACRGREGKILGIPVYQNSPNVYAIRADWLETLGLEAPETLEEAREVWRAFTFKDPDGNGKHDTCGYGVTMETRRGGHLYSLRPFMGAVRVTWYRIDDAGRYVPTFNTPEAAFVLDFIKSCVKEGLFGADVMVRPPGSVTRRFFAEDDLGMAGPFFVDWFANLANRYGMEDKVAFVPRLWKDTAARAANHYGTFTYLTRMRCLMRASPNKELAWRYLEYFFSQEWLSKYVSRRGLPFVRGRYLGQFGVFRSETPWRMVRHDVFPEVPLSEDVVAMVRPLEQYLQPTPMMTQWSQVSVELAETFVDYYLDRYDSAAEALEVAEVRFNRIVHGSDTGR